ncbi:MAG: hypothetical protein U0793_32920 [Gemmataceae bacterium]
MMPHEKVAVDFAYTLVNAEFEGAHALLAPSLSGKLTPADLCDKLFGMFRLYAEGKPKRIHFDEQFAQTNWPGKLPGDVGWVYVGIEGDDFVEAVTVIVAEVEGKHLIREIEWGRP